LNAHSPGVSIPRNVVTASGKKGRDIGKTNFDYQVKLTQCKLRSLKEGFSKFLLGNLFANSGSAGELPDSPTKNGEPLIFGTSKKITKLDLEDIFNLETKALLIQNDPEYLSTLDQAQIELLGIKDIKIEVVDDDPFEFVLACWDDKKIPLRYQGKIFNGVKQGYGRLFYPESENLFYEGHFKDSQPFGTDIVFLHDFPYNTPEEVYP
jgi:hypothetical protein